MLQLIIPLCYLNLVLSSFLKLSPSSIENVLILFCIETDHHHLSLPDGPNNSNKYDLILLVVLYYPLSCLCCFQHSASVVQDYTMFWAGLNTSIVRLDTSGNSAAGVSAWLTDWLTGGSWLWLSCVPLSLSFFRSSPHLCSSSVFSVCQSDKDTKQALVAHLDWLKCFLIKQNLCTVESHQNGCY